jgi:chromosome segregation ATPase
MGERGSKMSQTKRQKLEATLREKIDNLKGQMAFHEDTIKKLKQENKKLRIKTKKLEAKLPKTPYEDDE